MIAARARLATTDANGRYEIAELPAGRYNVTASKNSYIALSLGQQPAKPGTATDRPPSVARWWATLLC